MNRRITQCIAVTLVIVLAFGPCLAWSTPSTERKLIRSSRSTKRSSTKPARPFAAPAQESALRLGQSLTLLPDGRSLLLGGEANGESLATASITDVRTGAAIPLAAKLHRARAWHSATMLPDGRVLIVGGVDTRGRVVRSAEIFDPATQTFRQLPESEGAALAHHTATLLTSGSVLFTGGSTGQGASGKALLWDFKTGSFTSLSNRLSAARQKHRAILIHDGNVLIDGGIGEDERRLTVTELYNSVSGTFSFSSISADQADLREPFLSSSLPVNDARDVPTNSFAAIVFSKQLRVETINSDTLTLTGPEGVVKTKVVPTESGKLAFVTPASTLLPGVTYTISISGSVDATGQTITAGSISFTTKGEPENRDSEIDSEDWFPDEGNLRGNWRSKFKDSQWRSLPPLEANTGETALAGQTLMLDGKPLSNVTLRIGNNTALTDNTGRFLLTAIPSGHQVLTIDGRTANRNRRTYGTFKVGVKIQQGKTTALEYTIWMTKLDLARARKIPSPTSSRTVVTNPRIPGLELILPTGTLIRDTEGQHVTELSITPIPTNQPPFPLPPGIDVPVYFTIQPGGSQIIPPRAQLIYPNFIGSSPGTRIDFWNYDPTGKGWYVYGRGTVTPDGRQIVPDPGVVLYEFSGAMVGSLSFAPLDALIDALMGGDPVNLGSGLLVVQKLDLMLPDIIPINLTRSYRQNDTRSRAFGIGSSHPYDIFLVGDTFPYTFQDLILADGERIHYDRVSPGTGAGDAVYENLTEPGPFFKSRISANGDGWNLTLTDGTVYVFPDGFTASQPWQCALLRIQDRYGNVLQLDRDAEKKLTKITTPHNRWIQFTYDTSARITQATDNIGRTVGYTYDASGRLWKVTDPNTGVTEYTYDTLHRMLTIKDPRGIVYLTNEYDTNGRVIKQTLADDTPANSTDNPTYLFAYTTDSGGRIVQTDLTDPRGHIRRVTFGSNGYALTDTSAFGTPEQQGVSFEREAGTNFVRAMVDPLGRRSEFNYDSMGMITNAIEFAGTLSSATTSFTYEPTFHQLATVTNALNHTTTYDYDSSGNLISIANALNHETTFTYDARGRVTSITDPLQQTTQYIYDQGDLSKVIDPLNRTFSRFTDAVGRVIQIADASGNRTRYEYDPLNQIKKMIEHSGSVTEMSYDGNGNVLSLKDARNQTTSFTYDSMDRLLIYTDSLQGGSSTETFEYDLEGNPTRSIDRRGKVTTTTYDALDRPTFIGFGVTAGPTYESTIDYTYDLYDRVTQVVDSISGTIDFVFDDLARTAMETTPQGTVSFTYDKVGRLIAESVTGQSAISYSYDNANRLLSISQGLASVGFTYDNAGRRSTLTLPNGVVTEYGYNAASQLTSLTYRNGSTTIGDLTYSYDQSGRRKTMGGSLARTGLPQNLSTTNYNAANRLTQHGAATLSYDANGNLTNDGTNIYTWDARNQLVSISGAVSANFQYDPFGRRVRATINGTTTDYLYDGANVAQEKIGGTPSANLLTGGVDEIFSRTESGGTQSVLADGLGSTLALLSSAGATQTDYSYEPFGNTTIAGAASGNPSQYAARENDGTGLYYYRARYYSPKLQRFISEDPSDFAAGDTNLYAYVSNSPCNFTDPSGQFIAADCLIGMLSTAVDGLLSGRKFSVKSLVKGCANGILLGLAGRALLAGLAGLGRGVARGLRGGGGAGARAGGGPGPSQSPKGPQCFVAGTLIQTAAGTKPIEEVRAGDIVLSSQPERADATGLKPESQIVTQTFQRVATEVLDIRIGETTITATTEHPFWVVGAGWTAAGELRRGSALLTKDGLVVHVDTIERREGKFKVYNFEVANTHSYYVGASGILVHNQCAKELYRAGDKSPSGLSHGKDVSFRDSLSEPWPQQPTGPVFNKKTYIVVDANKLPAGSVEYDNVPPGHVTVNAAVDAIRTALIGGVRKF